MTLWRQKDHSGPGHKTTGELGHSQYGTPLGQIVHADLHYEKLKWLMIPSGWGEVCSGPQQFADDRAPSRWGMWVEQTGAERPDPAAVERTVVEFRTYAEKYGGFDPTRPFEIVTYLYLPDPRQCAMPVRVWVDDRPGLTVEAATADPDAIQEPVPEEFTTDALGTGRKVTSHGTLDPKPGDLPGTQGIWVTVRYAFAVPGRQAVVTVKATETDLARMSAAAADLDEFVRTITLTLADGTPVPAGPTPAT